MFDKQHGQKWVQSALTGGLFCLAGLALGAAAGGAGIWWLKDWQRGLSWLRLALGALAVAQVGLGLLFFWLHRKNSVPRWLESILAWILIFEAAAILLFLRYDWDLGRRQFSLRGYLSSLYLFGLTLPSVYFLLLYFTKEVKWARGITLVIFVIFTLPYHSLGLDRFQYCSLYPTQGERPCVPLASQQPALAVEWLPQGLANLPAIPGEGLFFGCLAGLGIATAVAVTWAARRRGGRIGLKAALWCGIWLLLLLQTWLHLSFRSPYTYTTHYQQPLSDNYWYIQHLFDGGKGVVNGDFAHFREVEEHFMGLPYEMRTVMLRRGYVFYLSSQFSFFVNDLYVFLGLHLLAWLAAVAAGFQFVRRHWGETTARFAAALIACGSGFIYFVAQPMSYFTGYVLVIVLMFLFQRLVVDDSKKSWGRVVLFGILLGLGCMVYDLFPLFLFFIGYAWLERQDWRRVGLPLLLSLLVYFGFLFLQTQVLHINLDDNNAQFAAAPMKNLVQMLAQPRIEEWYPLAFQWVDAYFGDLARAFLVLPMLLALAGLFFLKETRQKLLAAWMLLPSMATVAYLHVGKMYFLLAYFGNIPRFSYVAYPAVYTLAALPLAALSQVKGSPAWQRVATALAWGTVLLVFVFNNVDVFGFPVLYYHFYWPSGGFAAGLP